jgi:hypothetical protein
MYISGNLIIIARHLAIEEIFTVAIALLIPAVAAVIFLPLELVN